MVRSSSAARWLAPVYVCDCCGEEPLDGRTVCEDHTGSLWDEDYIHPTNIVQYDAGQLRRAVERVDIRALLLKGTPMRAEDLLQPPDIMQFTAQPEAKPAMSLWDSIFG